MKHFLTLNQFFDWTQDLSTFRWEQSDEGDQQGDKDHEQS